tara:strand:+ start:612 stop:2915 length:2304 start_codon:yes stop_codon:yes gene_type:complete
MSFLTGFATGLAKSVDTQLKESIERTRDNIDMVSKWRLKQAEEREKKRREKGAELDSILSNAAFVISGDANNPEALQMAGDLLKEQGKSAFLTTIASIDDKQRKSDVRVQPFFARAMEASQTAKSSINPKTSIIDAFLDADTSLPTMTTTLPTGFKPGGGLVAKLTDVDPFALGKSAADEQMRKIGMEIPTGAAPASSVKFGKTTFDFEGYNYEIMDINEKLTYLQKEELKPDLTEDDRKKLKDRRESLYQAALNQDDLTIQENMLSDQLNGMKPDDPAREGVVTQLTKVRRQKAINLAEADPDKNVLLETRATFLLQDAVDDNGNIVDQDKYMQGINLRRQATDNKEPITNKVKLERLIADQEWRRENVDGYVGSDDERTDTNNIAQQRSIIERSGTFDSNEIIQEHRNLESLAANAVSRVVGQYKDSISYVERADGSVKITMITSEDALNAVIKAYTDQYNMLKTTLTDQGLDTRPLDAAYKALVGDTRFLTTDSNNVDISKSKNAGIDSKSDAGIDSGLAGALDVDAGKDTTVEEVQLIKRMRKAIPNNEDGAKTVIADQQRTVNIDGTEYVVTVDNVISLAEALHGPEFKQLVSTQLETAEKELQEFFVRQDSASGKTMVIDPTKTMAAYGTIQRLFPETDIEEQKTIINMITESINKRGLANQTERTAASEDLVSSNQGADEVEEKPSSDNITPSQPSPIQLAMKLVDGTITAEERKLLRKAVAGEGGEELANAINMLRKRRAAEKEVSVYKYRGGLMGRIN